MSLIFDFLSLSGNSSKSSVTTIILTETVSQLGRTQQELRASAAEAFYNQFKTISVYIIRNTKLKYDQIIPNIDTSFFISLTMKCERFCVVNVCRL